MLIAIGLVIILAVTAATGFFVALEFAYTAVDRSRLEDIANDGDPRRAARARRALKICTSLSFALSGAQLGITVTALFVGFFAEPYLGQGLADLLGVAGVPAAVSVTIGVTFAFLFANVVQMILGELGPKNLAIARTEAIALSLAAPTHAYLTVCGPIIRFFDAASTKLLKRLGIQPVEELDHNATPEDLHRIIDVSRDEGALDQGPLRPARPRPGLLRHRRRPGHDPARQRPDPPRGGHGGRRRGGARRGPLALPGRGRRRGRPARRGRHRPDHRRPARGARHGPRRRGRRPGPARARLTAAADPVGAHAKPAPPARLRGRRVRRLRRHRHPRRPRRGARGRDPRRAGPLRGRPGLARGRRLAHPRGAGASTRSPTPRASNFPKGSITRRSRVW